MEESRKKKIVSAVALMLLLFMMIGASVAYFVGQIGTGATADINAITGTTDSLMFKVGNPINLVANMTNFKEGDGNVNSTTYANATLIANNGTNEASYNYNLYLDIIYNDLVYTTSDKKPELLLKITSKDNSEDTSEEGAELTSGITGVEYKTITTTSGTYSGFDITEKKGTVEIALNHEISTTSRKTNNWEIEVIFVNLDSDQQLNTEKVFRSELRIGTEDVEEKELLADHIKRLYTSQGENNLYLHDSTLENGAGDGSYRYAGGDTKLKEGYEKYNAIKELSACYLIDSDGNPTEIVDKGTEGAVCDEIVYYALNDEHATDIEKWWNLGNKSYILKQELTEEEQQFMTNFEQIVGEQTRLGNGMIYNDYKDAYYQYLVNDGTIAIKKIIKCYLIDSDGNPSEIVDKGTEGAVCEFGGYYALNDEHVADIEKYFDLMIRIEILGQELTEEEQQFMTNFEQIIEEQQALGNNMVYENTKTAYNQYVKNGGKDEIKKIIEDTIIKNYVCFGSNAEVCPDDNLYRIIGVFDNQVKLVKADYATSSLLETNGDYAGNAHPNSNYKGGQTTIAKYYWNYKNDTTINDGRGSNDWSTSLLNKVNLNTNYLNNIGNEWTNKIAMTGWYLGGWNTSAITAKEVYGYERGTIVYTGNPTTYEAKVGLMYPSDYGYATISDYWATNLIDYDEMNIKNNNWLYLGDSEWIISSQSSSSNRVFFLFSSGYLSMNLAYQNYDGVRPSFYLVSSTILTGGDGTKISPYRIN